MISFHIKHRLFYVGCCIYEKPRAWNESSSEEESDAECDHCYGHVEKKPKKKFHHSSPQGDGDPKENQSNSPDNNYPSV